MHPGTDRPATGTAPAPDPSAIPAQRAALIRLAAALDPRDFATTLAPSHGRPCLAVTSRYAAIGEHITADHTAYYWSWHECIAPTSDPAAAARKITAVLHAIPGHA